MREGSFTLKAVMGIGIPILLLFASLGYALLNRPSIKAADGVYYNPCCGVVRIRGEALTTNDVSVPIRQTVMKFGLTVYPTRDPGFFRDNGAASADQAPRPLLFNSIDQPSYFITTDAALREYKFQRVGPR